MSFLYERTTCKNCREPIISNPYGQCRRHRTAAAKERRRANQGKPTHEILPNFQPNFNRRTK